MTIDAEVVHVAFGVSRAESIGDALRLALGSEDDLEIRGAGPGMQDYEVQLPAHREVLHLRSAGYECGYEPKL